MKEVVFGRPAFGVIRMCLSESRSWRNKTHKEIIKNGWNPWNHRNGPDKPRKIIAWFASQVHTRFWTLITDFMPIPNLRLEQNLWIFFFRFCNFYTLPPSIYLAIDIICIFAPKIKLYINMYSARVSFRVENPKGVKNPIWRLFDKDFVSSPVYVTNRVMSSIPSWFSAAETSLSLDYCWTFFILRHFILQDF